jgi:hypothetical protein
MSEQYALLQILRSKASAKNGQSCLDQSSWNEGHGDPSSIQANLQALHCSWLFRCRLLTSLGTNVLHALRLLQDLLRLLALLLGCCASLLIGDLTQPFIGALDPTQSSQDPGGSLIGTRIADQSSQLPQLWRDVVALDLSSTPNCKILCPS